MKWSLPCNIWCCRCTIKTYLQGLFSPLHWVFCAFCINKIRFVPFRERKMDHLASANMQTNRTTTHLNVIEHENLVTQRKNLSVDIIFDMYRIFCSTTGKWHRLICGKQSISEFTHKTVSFSFIIIILFRVFRRPRL